MCGFLFCGRFEILPRAREKRQSEKITNTYVDKYIQLRRDINICTYLTPYSVNCGQVHMRNTNIQYKISSHSGNAAKLIGVTEPRHTNSFGLKSNIQVCICFHTMDSEFREQTVKTHNFGDSRNLFFLKTRKKMLTSVANTLRKYKILLRNSLIVQFDQ